MSNSLHNKYFTTEELFIFAKEFIIFNKAVDIRRELCTGCDGEYFDPNQTAHMDVIGCFEPWENIPSFIFEAVSMLITLRDIVLLYNKLSTHFSMIPSNIYITIPITPDDVKDCLIRNHLDVNLALLCCQLMKATESI